MSDDRSGPTIDVVNLAFTYPRAAGPATVGGFEFLATTSSAPTHLGGMPVTLPGRRG